MEPIRIFINKNPAAKQPFSVSYYSKKKIKKTKANPVGLELLTRCENLPTKANALTNIRSMGRIFRVSPDTFIVKVIDNTGLKPKEIEILL